MSTAQTQSTQQLKDYFRRSPAPARVGVFACGHHLYWPQFPALKGRLMEYHRIFCERLRQMNVEVVDGGLSDSAQSAAATAGTLHGQDVDLVIANVVTYCTSSAVVGVIQKVGRPAAIVGLQPAERLDYENATTFDQLCNDNVTSLPEIASALLRCGIEPVDAVFGQLHEQRAWNRIADLCRLARCLHILRNGRIGLMGHTYAGMLDMNSDPTMFTSQFGLHIEHLELDDLHQRVCDVDQSAVEERLELVQHLFHLPPPGADPIAGPVDHDELCWAARVSVGMDRLINDFNLNALAYYYRGHPGAPNERLGCSLIVGSSLLTGRGIPIAGEFDLKTCTAMLIMDRLGAGGSFAELHPADFAGDFVLVGHDGPHHVAIANGPPVLRGLSILHGKAGRGPSVEFAIQHGPITLLGLTQTADGRFKFVLAEGQSMAGPIPATGNTNTRGRFGPDVRTFIERWTLAGPTHHFALGVGWEIPVLEKLAHTLGIPCQVVARESRG
ncbi:MAG: arabinose isomerase [Planctomycetes bacterium]|nr:arabinose isomerase [Planctomycetota bacterium]